MACFQCMDGLPGDIQQFGQFTLGPAPFHAQDAQMVVHQRQKVKPRIAPPLLVASTTFIPWRIQRCFRVGGGRSATVSRHGNHHAYFNVISI